MKRLLNILLALCLTISAVRAGVHSYTDNSVLKTGHWVKIQVSSSGVCRMRFDQLRDAGIEPTQLRVYGYGGAMLNQDFSKRKIDDLPQVPVYTGEDYVLFYVQGPISWTYQNSRFVHSKNIYSNYGYYFLTDNVGSHLELTPAEALTGTPKDVYTYQNVQVHELDSINLVDKSGVSGGGKTFYGEQFTTNQSRTFRFATPNAVTSGKSSVYVDLAAYATTPSTFRAALNGNENKTVSITAPSTSDHYTFGVRNAISMTGTSASTQQQIQLTFQNTTASGALGWLNYIEVQTPCSLRMNGDWMMIRSTENLGSSTPIRFHLENATAATQIWDVTNRAAIQRIPATLNGTELTWIGTNRDDIHEYIAVNTTGSSYVSATTIGEVSNQNLHRLRNTDYVIICPNGYEAEAQRLAQAHEQKQGITWAVVTDQQVYNEFSSGTPDATAYRWLMKMLYDRANNGDGQKPRWLLLMGHGSFDNRNICVDPQTGVSYSGSKLLLTYQANNSLNEVQAYATDDYFGWLDDNEGTSDNLARMDVGVGRLPVESVEEATTTVDKLIRYMQNMEPGKWKNQLVYLADDGDGGDHTKTAEGSAEEVRVQNPDFVVHKVYLDAYPQETNASGESYPLAKNRIQNLLKNGVLFFDYSGHGGYNGVTSESVLLRADIDKMNNKNLGFWFFATCNFAQFDGGRRCAAEAAMLNPNGGAVGVFAATRTVYADQNTKLNRAVTNQLFKHSDTFHYEATLGEAIMEGKNKLSDDNKLAYVLLGDPAIRLNYPTDYWVETLTEIDTLNALSIQQVEGRIIDEDSTLVSDFNGTLDITIYDKMQVITTRDNDDKTGEPTEIPYNDYPNTIYTGSTTVTDGQFTYTFMVPKDIRYNYGHGRIVYYAHDDTYNLDAVGHSEQLIIGGTSNIVCADTTGPEMNIYLNSTAFRDGDHTYPTPRFFADLQDENGINTAGAGIGHDLMLIIDNDPKQTYTVNDYFTSANSSYRAGQVSYLLSALPDGPHSLSFRAWDLLNNSTTKSLNFVVESGLDPSIYSVTTYPNPVHQSGVMTMAVLYDQPDELLTTDVYIYNLSGQMIWHHTQDNPDQLQINLGELGMQPGVYVYSIRIKSATSKYSTCSGKIIVTK
ncbi:MAG: type IX secretion system sortase PorU [Paludibacteraceae bacterium]|nr:type IX secretion system sortase PorU [Paludibacteraceae bacterium]